MKINLILFSLLFLGCTKTVYKHIYHKIPITCVAFACSATESMDKEKDPFKKVLKMRKKTK